MKIAKRKGFNNYDITGLTEGKLLAILFALEELEKANKITAVQWDILVALRHWNI